MLPLAIRVSRGGANVYDYAANDPVNVTDRTGLLPGDEAGDAAQDYYAELLTDPKASTPAKMAAAIGGDVRGALDAMHEQCNLH